MATHRRRAAGSPTLPLTLYTLPLLTLWLFVSNLASPAHSAAVGARSAAVFGAAMGRSLGEAAAAATAASATPDPGPGAHSPVSLQLGTAANKCVDVPGNNQVKGAVLQQYDCNNDSLAQTFSLLPLGGNWYSIKSSVGLCLDVKGGWGRGAPLELWTCDSSADNQAFGFFNVPGSSAYQLRPRYACNLCLDVPQGSTSNSVPLELWDCNNSTGQLVTVNIPPAGPAPGTDKCADYDGCIVTWVPASECFGQCDGSGKSAMARSVVCPPKVVWTACNATQCPKPPPPPPSPAPPSPPPPSPPSPPPPSPLPPSPPPPRGNQTCQYQCNPCNICKTSDADGKRKYYGSAYGTCTWTTLCEQGGVTSKPGDNIPNPGSTVCTPVNALNEFC